MARAYPPDACNTPASTTELALQRRWCEAPAALVDSSPERLAASLWQVTGLRETNLPIIDLDAHHNIALLVSGRASCDFRLGDGSRCGSRFTPQMFALTGVGERPEAYVREADATVAEIYLPEATLARVIAEDLEAGTQVVRRPALVGRDPGLHRVALLLAEEGKGEDRLSGLMLDALTLELSVHLVRRWLDRERPIKPVAKGGLAAWQLRKVDDYLHDHLAMDVSLDDLAGLARLSRFHFARAFRQSTGVPPHRYHRQMRLDAARRQLSDTRLSVTDIATAVGYDSPQALARAFRQAFGISPAGFRREAA